MAAVVVGVVALVDPPPGFVVAFDVGLVVGVVGRPEIVLNTVKIVFRKRIFGQKCIKCYRTHRTKTVKKTARPKVYPEGLMDNA